MDDFFSTDISLKIYKLGLLYIILFIISPSICFPAAALIVDAEVNGDAANGLVPNCAAYAEVNESVVDPENVNSFISFIFKIIFDSFAINDADDLHIPK